MFFFILLQIECIVNSGNSQTLNTISHATGLISNKPNLWYRDNMFCSAHVFNALLSTNMVTGDDLNSEVTSNFQICIDHHAIMQYDFFQTLHDRLSINIIMVDYP